MARIYTLALLLLLAAANICAEDGIQCLLTVYQFDEATQEDVKLYEDTSVFRNRLPATGFIGPFSLEIAFKKIEPSGVSFDVHVITVGPQVSTHSRLFSMDYELPARLSGIEGKNGSRYSLVITPLSMVQIDEGCGFNHRVIESFTSSPSAFMDLYYVPSSLADYHWQSVRGYLDFSYRRFSTFANYTLPGKMLIYLSPCTIHSVIWDKRFGMAVDPTRNSAFALYSKQINSADPFIVTYTSLLRNRGYAPPFVAEGLANYFSFVLSDMKKILADQPDFSLRPMLNTYDYLKSDPMVADRTSASFAQFLVNKYQIDKYMELYKTADDVNMLQTYESVYGLDFESLEADWKVWVDTVTLQTADYSAAARLAEQMLNYKLMQQLAERLLEVAKNSSDSMKAYDILKRALFFNGDYYGATTMQTRFIEFDSTNATLWMARGSYKMMNGYYDEAMDDFEKAREMDPGSNMVGLNLALNYLYRGDGTTARQILTNNLSSGKGALAQGETRIFLADLLKKSGDSLNIQQANLFYQEVVATYQQTLQLRRSSSTHYLWLGIALYGLEEYDTALEHFQIADFLETRQFYSGMINLWLAKTYLRLDQTETAREHLANVLSMASADYHQREAREYLEQF